MKKTTMNKIVKIVRVLAIIAIVATMLSSVFATGTKGASEALGGLTPNTGIEVTGFKSTINNVIGIIQVICYGAAIIMLVILGVQFITASPEGKASIKKSAIQYVIGAIIVFAAGTLLGIISNISKTAITSA
jgi:trbC/VIRB2 family